MRLQERGETVKKTVYDMLYLAECALKSIRPDEEKVKSMDMEAIYKLSKNHSLEAIVYMGAEPFLTGELCEKWRDEKEAAVYKTLLLDVERKNILDFLEKSGIWYMPLKGIIIKELYPKPGMRQMADNDILYDARDQNELYKYMTARGYCGTVGNSHHDIYKKEPLYNYEMHTVLFDKLSNERVHRYFFDESRMKPMDGTKFGRKFSDEDFYIYVTAHEYKHFRLSGTGLRALLDEYVYIKNKKLDFRYIEGEMKKLGMADYEKRKRIIAEKLFETHEPLSKEEEDMIFYMTSSGTYGTVGNHVVNQMRDKNETRLMHYLHRIFPTAEYMCASYPFLERHKYLIPFGYPFRMVHRFINGSKRITAEMRATWNNKK